MADEFDQRTDPRLPAVDYEVEFPELRARVRNLSLSGVYVEDPRPIARGRVVLLRVHTGDQTITARAMVRRVDEGTGMSLEFVEMSADDRARLRALVGSDPVPDPSAFF